MHADGSGLTDACLVQRELLLHMGQTDAKLVSKIHCSLKKKLAPPGTWARCLVRPHVSCAAITFCDSLRMPGGSPCLRQDADPVLCASTRSLVRPM